MAGTSICKANVQQQRDRCVRPSRHAAFRHNKTLPASATVPEMMRMTSSDAAQMGRAARRAAREIRLADLAKEEERKAGDAKNQAEPKSGESAPIPDLTGKSQEAPQPRAVPEPDKVRAMPSASPCAPLLLRSCSGGVALPGLSALLDLARAGAARGENLAAWPRDRAARR